MGPTNNEIVPLDAAKRLMNIMAIRAQVKSKRGALEHRAEIAELLKEKREYDSNNSASKCQLRLGQSVRVIWTRFLGEISRVNADGTYIYMLMAIDDQQFALKVSKWYNLMVVR